jgi:hypothetical protein
LYSLYKFFIALLQELILVYSMPFYKEVDQHDMANNIHDVLYKQVVYIIL